MFRLIAVMAAIFMLAGCTTVIDARVNGFAAPGFSPALTHAVIPAEPDQAGDLQFQEAAAQVSRALVGAGLAVAPAGARPDVVVLLKYGVGEPRTVTSYSYAPVYGQTGVQSAQTTGTVTSMGDRATVNATTTYTPTYGVVGAQRRIEQDTVYDRYLTIQAVDHAKFEAAATIQQLWLIQVRSSGSSRDLRYVLPYMIRAAQPHFGRSTNRELSIPISVGDPAAEEIRTGAPTGIPGAPTSH